MSEGSGRSGGGGGKPWWVWLLGGCGGCLVILVIGGIVLGVVAYNAWKASAPGPITTASLQRDLGEVPLYPGSTVDVQLTRVMIQGFRFAERMARQKPGSMFQGVAVAQTPDSSEKVFRFYDGKMARLGWQQVTSRDRGMKEQRSYRKGDRMLIVQAQPRPGGGPGCMVTLMKGGKEIASHTGDGSK